MFTGRLGTGYSKLGSFILAYQVAVTPPLTRRPVIAGGGGYLLDSKTAEFDPKAWAKSQGLTPTGPIDYETPEFDPERYAYIDDWGQAEYGTGPITFQMFEEKVVRSRRGESGLQRFREEVKRIVWRQEQELRREIVIVTSTGVAYLVIKWLLAP